jgi:hypothetical protein
MCSTVQQYIQKASFGPGSVQQIVLNISVAKGGLIDTAVRKESRLQERSFLY